MKETTLNTVRTMDHAREAQVDMEVAKGTLYAIGGASALIGLWSLACFVGALSISGPIDLARGWISAVTGM